MDAAGNVVPFLFDPSSQHVFVTCDDQAIHVFNASGNGPTVETARLTDTFFSHPVGEAFDATTGGPQVIVSTSSMSGGAGPWPNTLAPLGIAVDNAGTLYASIVYFNSTAGAPDASNELAMWKTTSPTASTPIAGSVRTRAWSIAGTATRSNSTS